MGIVEVRVQFRPMRAVLTSAALLDGSVLAEPMNASRVCSRGQSDGTLVQAGGQYRPLIG